MKKLLITLALVLIAIPAMAATLSWDASIGADGYIVKYRVVADPTWIEAGTTSNTEFDVSALPLAADTRYEFQVFSTAGGSNSDGSDILRWTFEGAPQVIEVMERVKSLTLHFGE